jgi:hypothetical protein
MTREIIEEIIKRSFLQVFKHLLDFQVDATERLFFKARKKVQKAQKRSPTAFFTIVPKHLKESDFLIEVNNNNCNHFYGTWADFFCCRR